VFAALEAFGEPSWRELKNKSNGSMEAVNMIFNILFGPPGYWLASEESYSTSHNQAGEVKKILKSLVTVFVNAALLFASWSPVLARRTISVWCILS
jgi:hypothetical protein